MARKETLNRENDAAPASILDMLDPQAQIDDWAPIAAFVIELTPRHAGTELSLRQALQMRRALKALSPKAQVQFADTHNKIIALPQSEQSMQELAAKIAALPQFAGMAITAEHKIIYSLPRPETHAYGWLGKKLQQLLTR